MKKLMLTTVLAGLSAGLFAAEITWTGGGDDNLWTNTANWSGGAAPGKNDVAVFNVTGELLVNVGSSSKDRADIGGIKVEAGDVYFCGATPFRLNGAPASIDVADDSTLVTSNTVGAVTKNVTEVIKTGAGEWHACNRLGYLSSSSAFGLLDVREGVVRRLLAGGERGFYSANLHVSNGAMMYVNTYNSISDQMVVDLDEGAVLQLNTGGGTTPIRGLRGAGSVVKDPDCSDNVSCTLKLMLEESGDYVFSGTFEKVYLMIAKTAAYSQVISNSTCLVNSPGIYMLSEHLAFAPGVGSYHLPKLLFSYTNSGNTTTPTDTLFMPTEDIAGNPIELVLLNSGATDLSRLPFTGSGKVMMKSGSSKSTTYVKGNVNLDGAAYGSYSDTSYSVKHGDGTDSANDWSVTGASKLLVEGAFTYRNVAARDLGTFPVEIAEGGTLKLESVGLLTMSRVVRNSGLIDISCPVRFENMNLDCQHESLQILTGSTATVDNVTFTLDPSKSGDDALALPKVPSGYKGTLAIGEHGLKVRGQGAEYERPFSGIGGSTRYVAWQFQAATADGVATDGGVDIDFPGMIVFREPLALKGPVKLRGGYFSLNADAVPADGLAFGTGDFLLGSSYVRVNNKDTDSGLMLGCGAGANFRFGRGGAICEMVSGSTRAQTITLGPLLSEEVGSCFFITRENNSSEIDGSDSKVFVQGGLESYSNGMIKAPIFACVKSGTSDSSYKCYLMKYDVNRGLVSCEDLYTEGLEGGADSIAYIPVSNVADAYTLSAEASVQALVVSGSSGGNKTLLTLNKTLHVGNGTDPACVILNNGGDNVNYRGARIFAGKNGVLDFDTSEGFVVVNGVCRLHGASYGNRIDAKITGSAGVNYVGMFGPYASDYGHHPGVDVNGANNYSGGTRITGCSVRPSKATAFGNGLVEVGGMLAASGQIRFGTADLVFANDFKIRGNGVKMHGNTSTTWDFGALWFEKSTKLTGAVEIDTEARLFATNGVLAELSGAISGGKLKMFTKGTGEILLSGHSTYTGGTVVTGFEDPDAGMVPAVLRIVHGDSVGTGPIKLENAVLVFDNDEDITVANDISGNGTFRFAGTGKVTFTGDLSGLAIDRSEFTTGSHSISADNCFPPFNSMGLSGKDSPTLVFNGPGTYRIPSDYFGGNFQIVLTNGAKLDLCDPTGETELQVYRFTGNPADVINGKIKEDNPRTGMMLILR